MGFHTDQSRQNEIDAAVKLEKFWKAKIHSYGDYNAVDWWIEKGGRVWAVGEFKNRSIRSDKFPTLFISLRKWTMLQLASLTGAIPFFVVNFKDGLFVLTLQEAPVSNLFVHKRRKNRARNDTEPMRAVPVNMMQRIDNE